VTEDPATTMLDKLHHFSTNELSSEERGILGALMAPGIRWALEQDDEDTDVTAFGLTVWTPESLARGLRRAMASRTDAQSAPDLDS
jgi:hypothetical protein